MRVEKLRDRLLGLATRLSRTNRGRGHAPPGTRAGNRSSAQVSIVGSQHGAGF